VHSPWPLALSIAAFAVLALIAAITSALMVFLVNERMPAERQFFWLARNSRELSKKYAEFYPDSDLPFINHLIRLGIVALALVFVIAKLVNR
jgi:hypothetical protein